MGASEEEQPILPLRRHGSEQAAREGRDCCACLATFLIVVAHVSVGWFLVDYFTEQPRYSVEITAVSGLDPSTDLHGGAALDPVFNLTFGIASESPFRGACIDPRTTVKVSYSYLRLPLAGGHVPEVCAGPKERTQKRTVFARGVGVSVPGYMLDSLAEDMRSGEAVFEVKLIAGEDHSYRTVATCWAKVGAGLEDRCFNAY